MSRNKCFLFLYANITCFTFYINLLPIYWLSFVQNFLILLLTKIIRTLRINTRAREFGYVRPIMQYTESWHDGKLLCPDLESVTKINSKGHFLCYCNLADNCRSPYAHLRYADRSSAEFIYSISLYWILYDAVSKYNIERRIVRWWPNYIMERIWKTAVVTPRLTWSGSGSQDSDRAPGKNHSNTEHRLLWKYGMINRKGWRICRGLFGDSTMTRYLVLSVVVNAYCQKKYAAAELSCFHALVYH
jgi:hypothetical protein